jgi:putative oxidoreductase
MNDSYKSTVSLVGRILLAAMFVQAGFGKLTAIAGTAAFIASAGLPAPSVLAVLAGLLELVGGIALIVGWRVRLVGAALAAFTAVASVIFHPFWSAPEAQKMVVTLLFMKNVSVIGGMLLVSALGAGPLSVDARRGDAA